jgi:Fur family ferric uptake transcriptional regulator
MSDTPLIKTSKDNELKESGFKITIRRRKILEALENSENKHLSAEDLYNLLKSKGEEISLATIYRVLTQFEAAGIVNKHNFEENCAVFELSVEEHHDHLVCVKCGKILEFVDDTIEERQIAIAKQYNFKITDHSLSIYGECESCQ